MSLLWFANLLNDREPVDDLPRVSLLWDAMEGKPMNLRQRGILSLYEEGVITRREYRRLRRCARG